MRHNIDSEVGCDGADELYRRHASNAFRCARRMLGNEADAIEIVHDVFLSLLQRPEQYTRSSSFGAFLYGAVTHACLNWLRRRSTRLRVVRDRAPDIPLPAAPGVHPEHAAAIQSALERLPEVLAQVAIYYHLHGCTHDEIAGILGCSRRHVGDLIRRLDDWVREQDTEARRD